MNETDVAMPGRRPLSVVAASVALAALVAGCAGLQGGAPPSPAPAAAKPAAALPPTESRAAALAAAKAAQVAAGAPPAPIAADRKVREATAKLDAAAPAARPAALLARARAAMAAAQALRWSKMRQWDLIPPEDEATYVAYYELAMRDCSQVLDNHPSSPEAPEAQLTVAEIHDYPHMTDFQRADAEYQRTMERYPGTPAAAKAAAGLRRIREHLGAPSLPPPSK